MDLATVLTSDVLAAVVSGLVALRNSERKIVIENITQERTKWRDKIREKNLQAQEAFQSKEYRKIKTIGSELRLLLNPVDPLDQDILREINLLCSEGAKDADIERFSIKLCLLLKHDWERAKQEANASVFCNREKANRVTYEQYLEQTANKENLADAVPRG
jgi:hypothetical protein